MIRPRSVARFVAVMSLTAVVFGLSTCATTGPEKEKYVRDGVQYGITKGRFRGRWWNYYERGRSFLDGGFYAEAESDLRAALSSRSRDQLWPRTYGLHFLPEYFPHRELGVALVRQDRIEESISELETSVEQRYSARAAHYLTAARKTWVNENDLDADPPVIDLDPSLGSAPLFAMNFTVRGAVRDDTFVESVEIDGQRLDLVQSGPYVDFEHSVPLRPGQNAIEIVALDVAGRTASTTLALRADHDGPAVSFDETIANGRITGAVYDPVGVETLSINEQRVALTQDSGGVAVFSHPVAGENVDDSVRYSAADSLGNETSGTMDLSNGRLVSAGRDRIRLAVADPIDARMNWIPAVAATDGVRIDIANLQDGQAFYLDEIVVSIDVTAANPIAEVTLNDESLATVPGRNAVRVSRRIQLAKGENQFAASSRDVAGNAGAVQKTVNREPNDMELPDKKLSVAFLEDESLAGERLTSDDRETVIAELSRSPDVVDRFTVVDRERIRDVLQEQELSELLSSRNGKLATGRLIGAEMLLATRIRSDEDTVEIVVEGTSTETGTRLTRRVDVAGPTSQLQRLIQDLSVRLVQEFPRVRGSVVAWDDPRVYFDLTNSQGIRQHFKCLVVEMVTIGNENFRQEIPEVLCQGLVESVGADLSWAEIVAVENEDARPAIEVGQYVVTK